jgi:hypothetical protein
VRIAIVSSTNFRTQSHEFKRFANLLRNLGVSPFGEIAERQFRKTYGKRVSAPFAVAFHSEIAFSVFQREPARELDYESLVRFYSLRINVFEHSDSVECVHRL